MSLPLTIISTIHPPFLLTAFAYGATGAGKTYTMLGSEKSPGIMYLTMVELYKRIEARKEEKICEVLVSYQEVYNEQIHDLLEPKGPLAIWEDPKKGVVVQGLSFHQPMSAEQLLETLAAGNKKRVQHPTDANATSSRSHAIFQICVKQWDRICGLTRDFQVARMSLVDLAGSERSSVTDTKGKWLWEGTNINRSLLALINFINALADGKSKKTHIPYRNSKLTRLLKDSIGGNCRTTTITAVSPCVLAYEDTYNTLKYASRAKDIKQSLRSNVLSIDSHISKDAAICKRLQAEVADLQAKLRAYKDAAREAENQVLVSPVSRSPQGFHGLEEAVPKTGLALDDQRESDGEEQQLKAGWPVKLQLESEEAPEEMLPSSPRATHQTDLQLELKKPSCLLQGLSGSQTEMLVAAILSVARKQYSVLKAASLLAPDMVSEFEELEHLVHQEAGVSLEQGTSLNRSTEVSAATSVQRVQQGCNAEMSFAVPSTPVRSATLQCLEQVAPLSRPTPMAPSPTKKRRRSEVNSASQVGAPCSLKTQTKLQRRCGKEAETPRVTPSPGTLCLKAAAQAPPVSPVSSCCTPGTSLLTATKRCVPLMVSAAQNGCTQPALPVHNLNVTFDIYEDSSSPGADKPVAFNPSEFSVWESIQNILNKQNSVFVAKTCIPLSVIRGSSIPKPSSVSRVPAQKRKRVESTASPSLGVLQSHISQLLSSSQRSRQPSRIPEPRSSAIAWKGSKETSKKPVALGSACPRPTPQPMKLLC
ncbi:kinesin-like protein KIF18B [Falco peregrinus]|uniref:kinesin-like protein KIF18B n=1 Tax=Falco peregrinus TaxID=8954 RepID=UPI00247A8F29|nr:kinesin-like protein KIF18B [Falco peregrinus]